MTATPTDTASATATITITPSPSPTPKPPPVNLTISPTLLNFGNVKTGAAPIKSVTLHNKSKTIDTIIVSQVTGQFFSLASNTCDAGAPPGGTCKLGVSFAPLAAGKKFNGSLTFNDQSKKSGHKISLKGKGVSTPTPKATPTPFVTATATETCDRDADRHLDRRRHSYRDSHSDFDADGHFDWRCHSHGDYHQDGNRDCDHARDTDPDLPRVDGYIYARDIFPRRSRALSI